nr:unnamed protein product [Digitaria exilis]
MADVVSDLVLSFFCCCFYAPGDNGVGAHHHHHHYGGGHYAHPTGRNAVYHHGGRSRHVPLQTVELRVGMCCQGCERVVRQAIQNLRGVESVEVNLRTEKVTVRGYVDRMKVLQEVRRSGKKAEFWPSGGGGGAARWFASSSSPRRGYFRDDGGGSYRRDSYNYRRHGYSDGNRRGRMREPARGGNMFNDDDDDAGCRIM